MTPESPLMEPSPEHGDDRLARALRSGGWLGISSSVLIALAGPVLEPLGAVLALLWAWRSRTPLRSLGLVRPRNLALTVLGGLTAGVLLKLAFKSVVMPLLGAPPANEAYRWLTGNTTALPGMVWDVLVGAGFNEELVFRGFLFLQLGKAFGHSRGARLATWLLTSLYFGGVHAITQGLPGAEQATLVGLLFGGFYLVSGRLWPVIVAHASFDLTAVFLIYRGLEPRVAHWFFR
jgi:membrane protease YdiL (CAAX protease family)